MMPDLVEQMYCSQQIHIPPTFPFILKQYAKAAIRTQPYDLLRWSAAYFRAMAQGEVPPVKKRLEYPPPDTASGLSPGYLKVLLQQLGKEETIPASILYDKWSGICLDEEALTDMLKLGEFEEEVDWMKFIAIASGHLAKSITQTMYLICELLTEEPEGGSDMIPFETFTDLYTYLARMECGPEEEADMKMSEEEAEEEQPAAEEEQPAAQEEQSAAEQPSEEEEELAEAEEEYKEPKKEIAGIGPIIPDKQIHSVIEYLKFWAERQEGMVMPRNIHHFLCPSLDKVPVSD